MAQLGQHRPVVTNRCPINDPFMHLRTMKRTLLVLGLSTALAGAATLPATAGTGTPNTATATQWQLMGPNASGGHLAFTPAMPSRVYVLPDRGMRIDRSDDHGVTWQPQAKFAIPNGVGMRLAADPHDPDVLYVAGRVLGSGQGFLLRSDDGARTFHTVVDSPTEISDVVVSPSGRYVFAAGDAGVFVSSDHGLNWQQLPGSPSGATRLALDDHDLFVGTGKGIYLIEDALGNAGPARKLPTPLELSVQHLSAQGSVLVASNIFQGAVFSTDHGRNWTQLTGPWGEQDAILYTGLTASGELQVQTVAGAADGSGAKNLWVSRDLGRTWIPKPAATKALDVYTDTGSFPDRPQEQVIAAAAGIYTTSNSVRFQRIGAPDAEVDSLTVSGSALIAGTATAGSYRSTAPLTKNLPQGYQEWGWTGQRTDTIGNQIEALATVPGEKGDVLRTRGGLCMTDCFALERSTDGGASWRTLAQVPGGASFSVAVDPGDTAKIYAASTFPAVGVYASQDGGATFQLHQFPELQGVASVAVDRRADGGLWIGDVTGLYHSTDSGSTGVKVFDGQVNRVAVDPTDPNHIVVVGDGMIKVSHDGGASFSDAVGIAELTYDDVTFAPDGTLFAASRDLSEPGQGVFRSDDGGSHWSNSVSAQLLDPDVHSVLVSPDGHWLFAGTGSGVYRLPLS
ncbi:hypothetical protein GCM10011579_089040 [Streptomyces albiflavescens]|uniref:Uncharacterized protein n=1 Tax=Streptomyces albiflavescens TaxID=1623582 RepID=A0A917YFV7_9ACTN|nr:sialidase family protein [Streptomyces albiflavescens]GGN91816.1 hypothetical protein GCM10011579_089040 [Streptomyces albiflavescens]